MRSVLVVLVMVVGVSCGAEPGGSGPGGTQHVQQQVPDVAQPQVSGSRLKAIWRVGADGSRLASGTFFDTVLGVKCTVTKLGPLEACTPSENVASVTSGFGTFFSDPTCLDALTIGQAGTAFLVSQSGFVAAASIYTGATFRGDSGTCAAATPPTAAVMFRNAGSVDVVAFTESNE